MVCFSPRIIIFLDLLVTVNQVYFDGSMDEVRIWDTALTSSEIQDNMNNLDDINFLSNSDSDEISDVETDHFENIVDEYNNILCYVLES